MTWDSIALKLVEILLPVIGLLLTALIGLGVAYLQKQITRISNEVARESLYAALAEADKVARDAVMATQQQFVDELKQARKDGKLTSEEKAEAARKAQLYFMTHLSSGSVEVLEAAVGPVEQWLTGLLEAKVAEQKQGSVALRVEQLANPLSSRPAEPAN